VVKLCEGLSPEEEITGPIQFAAARFVYEKENYKVVVSKIKTGGGREEKKGEQTGQGNAD